jgi:hypothetical protein
VVNQLLSDGEGYLHDAKTNLGDVGQDQRGEVQSQLQGVEHEDRSTRTQVEQQGPSEQNGTGGGAGASPSKGAGSSPPRAAETPQGDQGTSGSSGREESSPAGGG